MITARTLYRAWRLCRTENVDLFRIDTAEPLMRLRGWDALGMPTQPRDVTTVLEMLRAIELRHRDESASASRASLVATLPAGMGPVAATRDVAEALIRASRRELLVVGYRVNEPAFRRLLMVRGMEGIEITVVSDRGEDDAKELLEAWPAGAAPLLAYRGIEPVQGQSLVHAKAIVADRNRALVGSANFTAGGFRNNVEIGVEIEGDVPAQIVALVQTLIRRRYLEPVSAGR